MRLLRDSDPSKYRLITIRTEEARMWMLPCAEVQAIVGGILAKYQEIFKVEIYAYVVLANHYHLIVRAPRANLDEFAENVNREVARRMNWRNGRRGTFWARRYDDQEIISEEDLLEAFLYVTTNPTRHGLVADSANWPGLISYRHALDEQDRVFNFVQYSFPSGPRTTNHKLTLSVLPQFRGLTHKDRRKAINALVKKRLEELAERRKGDGKGFLSLVKLRKQHAGAIPREVSRSPRPWCYTKSAVLRKEHLDNTLLRRERYDYASMRFRAGKLNVEFPKHSYKPPLHRKPRILPFTPLSPEHFKKAA